MMKAKLVFLTALAWGCGLSSLWAAVPFSEAVVRVHARVEPHIAVSEPVVVIIDFQGDLVGSLIPSQVQFSIRANTQAVELQVACTDLYKAGDPTSPHRIPVAGSSVEIACEDAGSARSLTWEHGSTSDALPSGWTGSVSEIGTFTSPSTGSFSQDVTVDVAWYPTDPDLPTGEYRGIVRLVGMIQP